MSQSVPPNNRSILPQGALIEFVVQGSYVKVSAVDPVTYIEVSIVGDPHVGEKALTQQVIRKLERIVFKRKFDKDTLRKEADRTVLRGKRQDFPSGWDL